MRLAISADCGAARRVHDQRHRLGIRGRKRTVDHGGHARQREPAAQHADLANRPGGPGSPARPAADCGTVRPGAAPAAAGGAHTDQASRQGRRPDRPCQWYLRNQPARMTQHAFGGFRIAAVGFVQNEPVRQRASTGADDDALRRDAGLGPQRNTIASRPRARRAASTSSRRSARWIIASSPSGFSHSSATSIQTASPVSSSMVAAALRASGCALARAGSRYGGLTRTASNVSGAA